MRCGETVAPAILMCKRHWYMVPRDIRMRVLRSYRPGQERVGWEATSPEYQDAVREAIAFVARKEGHAPDPMAGVDVQ